MPQEKHKPEETVAKLRHSTYWFRKEAMQSITCVAWVHSPPGEHSGDVLRDPGCGDDSEDQADAFRPGHGDQDDLP